MTETYSLQKASLCPTDITKSLQDSSGQASNHLRTHGVEDTGMAVNSVVAQEVTVERAGVRFQRFLRGTGVNILLVTASALLASLLFPPHEIWWLAWLCLVPLLLALRRTLTVRGAGWLMLWFGMVYFAAALPWFAGIFGAGAVGLYIITTLPWILFGLAYRIAAEHKAGRRLALLAPVLFLAIEWIRCEGWYFQFSWAQFGYTLIASRHGNLLYPIIGVYGATFLIVLVNALLAEIISMPVKPSRKVLLSAPLVVVVLAISALFSLPSQRTTLPPAPAEAVNACIVQSDAGSLEEFKQHTLAAATRTAPSLVVWPECALLDYPLSNQKEFAELQALARRLHCILVLGCKDHVPAGVHVDTLRRHAMLQLEGQLFYNTALVIGPDGNLVGKYYKTHPIQLFSDGVPGRETPAFATPVGRLGVAICYDFDFASTNLGLVHHGAELLVTPTYDAAEWSDVQHKQHGRMAQARAAECARWVVRATASGESMFINPQGRVVDSLPNRITASLTGPVACSTVITPYMRFGYLLPGACFAVSLLWVGLMLIEYRQKRRRKLR